MTQGNLKQPYGGIIATTYGYTKQPQVGIIATTYGNTKQPYGGIIIGTEHYKMLKVDLQTKTEKHGELRNEEG